MTNAIVIWKCFSQGIGKTIGKTVLFTTFAQANHQWEKNVTMQRQKHGLPMPFQFFCPSQARKLRSLDKMHGTKSVMMSHRAVTLFW